MPDHGCDDNIVHSRHTYWATLGQGKYYRTKPYTSLYCNDKYISLKLSCSNLLQRQEGTVCTNVTAVSNRNSAIALYPFCWFYFWEPSNHCRLACHRRDEVWQLCDVLWRHAPHVLMNLGHTWPLSFLALFLSLLAFPPVIYMTLSTHKIHSLGSYILLGSVWSLNCARITSFLPLFQDIGAMPRESSCEFADWWHLPEIFFWSSWW